jgi:serine/threonine protein kinase
MKHGLIEVIKIIDFSSASIRGKGTAESDKLPYSPYLAPETFEGVIDERCDLWSLGVIAYILICGKLPFDAKNRQEQRKLMRNGVKFDP